MKKRDELRNVVIHVDEFDNSLSKIKNLIKNLRKERIKMKTLKPIYIVDGNRTPF